MSDRVQTPMTNEHFAAFCRSMVGQPYGSFLLLDSQQWILLLPDDGKKWIHHMREAASDQYIKDRSTYHMQEGYCR